jgi:LytS/YehU family sensor histidine kinase
MPYTWPRIRGETVCAIQVRSIFTPNDFQFNVITNSIKHAFPSGRGGEIFIKLHSDNNNLILTAGDNGAGIPEDLDFRNTESLGLKLIDAFVEQLDPLQY